MIRHLLLAVLFVSGILAFFTSGCTTEEELRAQRLSLAVQHFDKAKYREVPLVKLTLRDCIEQALEHNLDLKVNKMEADVSDTMRVAELLRMLPEINFNYTGTIRTNTPASSSEKEAWDGTTYGATTSQDKNLSDFNLDFALSVMDFGLAFFNTQQAQDRFLMRKQRNIRIAQNLVLDVTKVYYDVAVYQRAKQMSKNLLVTCRQRINQINDLAKKKEMDPFTAFEEIRRFNDMERRLEYFSLQFDNASIELRTLLGYYPTSEIMVDDSVLDSVPDIKLPQMEVMEQIALLNRPELAESDMQRHINVVECHKIILSMFPSTRLFIDFNANSNSFLYNRTWWDMGISAAIDLMKLPARIAQLSAQSKSVDAEDIKAYGKAITIIAQVRVSHADILSNKAVFEQDTDVYNNYREAYNDAERVRRNAGKSSTLSLLEVDHMHLQTVNASILRLISLGNYQLSYFRLMNAMGIDNLDPRNLKALQEKLKKLEFDAETEIVKAKDKDVAAR